jgi:hypothetical protein
MVWCMTSLMPHRSAQRADALEAVAGVDPPDSGHVLQIVEDQHVVVQGRRLRQVAQHGLDLERVLVDAMVLDADAAGGRPQKPREHPQGGGFAGAVRAQQAQNLPLPGDQADAVHRADGAVVLGQTLDVDHAAAPVLNVANELCSIKNRSAGLVNNRSRRPPQQARRLSVNGVDFAGEAREKHLHAPAVPRGPQRGDAGHYDFEEAERLACPFLRGWMGG